MSLQQMLDTQKKLQSEFDPRAASGDPQDYCEYIKDMSLALVAETMEMMEETGWKPWTTSWHVNLDPARAEFIDMLHFILNIANRLGFTEEEILRRYNIKAEINLARIRGSYDGVSTKCPGCKRAMDDPATLCMVSEVREGYAWCEAKGYVPIKK